MKRFLLYGHGGAYNHGAEAIVKTTIKMIREKYSDSHVALSSHFPEQDREFFIDCNEIFAPDTKLWEAEKRAASLDEKKKLAGSMYTDALNTITPETVLLSVGGDNFCYPNWHRLAVFQQEATRTGAKSILWGCSVEPSAITPQMIDVLNSHTCILAREVRTYNALKKRLDTEVHLLSDPAFLLEPESLKLLDGFKPEEIIGINLSPLILRKESVPGILMENMRRLIDYILSETNMNIALIPHVTMSVDNDYEALSELRRFLSGQLQARVWLVGEKYSAAQYKSVISKCKLLVCARTHASIAAYSSGVPALVTGYSTKSAGIAEDLGMDEFVLDIAEIKSPYVITDLFRRLLADEENIRRSLQGRIKSYIAQAKNYIEYI